MRKTILAGNGFARAEEKASASSSQAWLDLGSVARVEVSSESSEYPVEKALISMQPNAEAGHGWQAGSIGPQTLRLIFDTPQTIHRIFLHFHESERERMQEFSLEALMVDGRKQEIVRQQWTFSPGGLPDEHESYAVKLKEVVSLTLWIDPDRGQDRYPATLAALRIEA